MFLKFGELFRVEFRHLYFGYGTRYTGITATPSEKTREFFLNNNLLFKPISGGFIVGYETGPGSAVQGRIDVLKTRALLTFRLDLADLRFYNYTGNLPDTIQDLVFHFWNYNSVDETYRKQGRLQAGDGISGDDMNDTRLLKELKNRAVKAAIAENADPDNITVMNRLVSAILQSDEFRDRPHLANIFLLEDYFSKPFGQLSIKLDPDPAADFAERFVLAFDSLATYWQYILRSDHLAGLKAPAIVNNKSNQPEFEEAVNITLPDEKEALCITSKQAIPLSREPQRKFRLVTDFDAATKGFRELQPPMILPDPDINTISNVAKILNDDKEKKYSIIIL